MKITEKTTLAELINFLKEENVSENKAEISDEKISLNNISDIVDNFIESTRKNIFEENVKQIMIEYAQICGESEDIIKDSETMIKEVENIGYINFKSQVENHIHQIKSHILNVTIKSLDDIEKIRAKYNLIKHNHEEFRREFKQIKLRHMLDQLVKLVHANIVDCKDINDLLIYAEGNNYCYFEMINKTYDTISLRCFRQISPNELITTDKVSIDTLNKKRLDTAINIVENFLKTILS